MCYAINCEEIEWKEAKRAVLVFLICLLMLIASGCSTIKNIDDTMSKKANWPLISSVLHGFVGDVVPIGMIIAKVAIPGAAEAIEAHNTIITMAQKAASDLDALIAKKADEQILSAKEIEVQNAIAQVNGSATILRASGILQDGK